MKDVYGEPKLPNKGGVPQIYMIYFYPESPMRGGCLTHIMNRYRQMWGACLTFMLNRYRQSRGARSRYRNQIRGRALDIWGTGTTKSGAFFRDMVQDTK